MPHVELPQAEFKVVMLGDTFTGKTSLVLRFAEGYYRDSGRDATVGAFFITKRLSVFGITCKVQIWDTAGQEQFKKLAPMYYKNAAAAIVCYDITSPKSFETMRFWIDELQRNVEEGCIVIAICATKCDLSQNPDTSEAEELAQQTGAMFLTTSAKNNTNVTSLFEQVAERVLILQRQSVADGKVTVPVTLATTFVETSNQGAHEDCPGDSHLRISSHPTTSEEKKSSFSDAEKHRNPLDDEHDVVDPAESKESSRTDLNSRCDATNMLMCGQSLDGESNSMGCHVM